MKTPVSPKSDSPKRKSYGVGEAMLRLSPQERERAIRIAAKLLARKAKKLAEAEKESGTSLSDEVSAQVSRTEQPSTKPAQGAPRTDPSRVWLPGGINPAYKHLLSVPANGLGPMDRSLYLTLLEEKLAAWVAADPRAARRALEMSMDSAPELWSIAHQVPNHQWASALVRSDGMMRLLASVTWQGSTAPKSDEPTNFEELLELLA